MKIKFWPFLIPILATAVLVRLGFWQLERAEQKQQALEQLAQQQELSLENWVSVQNKQELHSQRVRISGNINAKRIWLLDNKVHQGQVGYSVVTKFRLKGLEQEVLVDWGWIKAPSRRDVLPEVTLPQVELVLTGLVKSEGFGQIVLKQTKEQGWPRRIQSLQELDMSEGVIYADDGIVAGTVQIYKPVVMPPEKHKAYAMQWFLLALACVLVFLFASRKKGVTNEN